MTKLGTLALATLVAAIAGCSGASPDAPSGSGPSGNAAAQDAGSSATTGDCQPGLAAKLCVKATVDGRVTHTGTSKADLPDVSCAAWMQGKEGRLRFPVFFDKLDGAEFGFGSLIAKFAGPGTYSDDALSGMGMGFTVFSEREFEARDGSTATLTIDANGNGSLDFKDFIEIEDVEPRSPALSGHVTWTCVDGKE